MKPVQRMLRRYAYGERTCAVCKADLPEHDGWAGSSLPVCTSPECAEALKALRQGVWIVSGTVRCDRLTCGAMVPEGRYLKRSHHCCSVECWWKLNRYGSKVYTCGCCGIKFNGVVRDESKGLVFLNTEHWLRYKRKQNRKDIGCFESIHAEFLKWWEQSGRAPRRGVGWELYSFLRFLTEEGIADLNDVHGNTITAYLKKGAAEGQKSVGYTIPTISSFFNFLIANGLRVYANPVVPFVHKRKRGKKKPNPLNDEESQQFLTALEENGSPMIRLAGALALEGGARAGEVCNMRMQDFDEKKQKAFIRLPNKGKKERFMWFSDLTLRYYREWMAVRPKDCGHDGLLVNRHGGRLKYGALRDEYLRTLAPGTSLGSQGNHKTSCKQHRLRHTFATNQIRNGTEILVLKVLGGWESFSAMDGYIDIFESKLDKEYHRTMKRSRDRHATPNRKTVLTLAEALAEKRKREGERHEDQNRYSLS